MYGSRLTNYTLCCRFPAAKEQKNITYSDAKPLGPSVWQYPPSAGACEELNRLSYISSGGFGEYLHTYSVHTVETCGQDSSLNHDMFVFAKGYLSVLFTFTILDISTLLSASVYDTLPSTFRRLVSAALYPTYELGCRG